MADIQPNNPMKSTWRNDKANWKWTNRAIYRMDPGRDTPLAAVPVHEKADKVPYLSQSSTCLYVFAHAFFPVAIHYSFVQWTGKKPWTIVVYLFYVVALRMIAQKQMGVMHHLGLRYGYLDGDKHARDYVPDAGVGRVFGGMIRALTLRPMIAMIFTYNRDVLPGITWTLPIKLALYSIVLDFWFYAYHRACHEVEFLWRYHRTHHLTKHPNPLLVIYADDEQEVIEIIVIPLLTWAAVRLLGFPINFYEWFICTAFMMFTELWGHSGLRIHYVAAGPASFILQYFNCELTTEDHDMHHRKGWKKASNYGKQTRLWDQVFGTTSERLELADSNVDWNRPVHLPLFAK